MNCSAFNILFCAIYIPPAGSAFSDLDIFDTLESDLLELNPENNFEVCLPRYFNSHTINDSDFIITDENMEQILYIDNTNGRFNRITIEELGFPIGRHNSDNSQIDNYRRRLLEVCRSFSLYIANGRLGSDKFLGSKTCKASTVVDYAILSALLFTAVKEFQILLFDPMLSDVHCGIHISLSYQHYNPTVVETNQDDVPTVVMAAWDASKLDSFLQNLNTDGISQFINHMNSVQEDITKETVELLTAQCSSLLYNAADAAGMLKHRKLEKRIRDRTLV